MNINICERCGGNKSMVIDYTVATPYPTAYTVTSGAPLTVNLGFPFTVSAAAPAQWATTTPCTCSPEPKHDGNLGHNSTVFYEDDPYMTSTGETFYVKSVMLSDKIRHLALIPKEALSLLAWLEQERLTLEQLAKEQTE